MRGEYLVRVELGHSQHAQEQLHVIGRKVALESRCRGGGGGRGEGRGRGEGGGGRYNIIYRITVIYAVQKIIRFAVKYFVQVNFMCLGVALHSRFINYAIIFCIFHWHVHIDTILA